MDSLKDAIRNGISFQKTLMETLDTDKESIQKAHRFGPNNVLPAFFAMDYDSLKSLADEFFADKSDTGIFKANLFGEMLGNTGKKADIFKVKIFKLEWFSTREKQETIMMCVTT